MRSFLLGIVCLISLVEVVSPAPALALQGQIALQGAEFVLRLADGRVLRREELIGLTLVLGNGGQDAAVRIAGIEEDRTVPEDPVVLYRLSTHDPKTGTGSDVCLPDPKGRRAALAYPDGAGGFNLSCTSGAEGKCILLGYRPWQVRDGVPMRDLHRACFHMLRADYGGDDRPTTQDGTLVNLYDRFEIQERDPETDTAFEAAWGAEGAVCVAHPRIAGNVSLEELAARYPRLKGQLGPQACSEEAMRADPRALIFNRSVPTSR